MASDYLKKTPLSDLITLQRGFDLPSTKREFGKIPVVASTGIVGFHNEVKVKAPGVVIGRSGSIGGGQYITSDFWPLNTTLWVKDFKGHHQRYIYYLLKNIDFSVFNVGSGVPTLNRNHLSSVLVLDIPFEKEKNIADLVGSLDDKIELNRQMNTTLESMAQALFKSWFVDFDPVIDNALAAGNPIPDELQAKAAARLALGEARKPLPADIQALFPSSFVLTEEMGWIPEGWGIESLINMVDSISETYPLKKIDDVIFLNTGDILDGTVLHDNYSSTSELPGQAKKSIKMGDILYSEIRPQNKRFAYINFDAQDYVVSTKLMVLRTKSSYDSLFCYFILKQEETISILQHIAETRSGTFPQITFKELGNIKVSLPPNGRLVESFGKLFLNDFFKKFFELKRNSKLLENLRDTLLPKLLSGELRIPDAEKLAAEVL